MSIKGRVTKLENQRATKKEILAFEVLCADTNKRLTEASKQATYTCGSVSVLYKRKAGEPLRCFVKRALEEGSRLAVENHPNAIFVHGGVKSNRD